MLNKSHKGHTVTFVQDGERSTAVVGNRDYAHGWVALNINYPAMIYGFRVIECSCGSIEDFNNEHTQEGTI